MRREIQILLLLLWLGPLTTAVALGQEAPGSDVDAPAAEKPAEAPKRGKLVTIKGEVIAVDFVEKSVKIKEREKEVMMSVIDGTIITAGKTTISFTDLKAGDKVVVRFTEQEGKKEAHSIRVARLGERRAKKETVPEGPPQTEESQETSDETPSNEMPKESGEASEPEKAQ